MEIPLLERVFARFQPSLALAGSDESAPLAHLSRPQVVERLSVAGTRDLGDADLDGGDLGGVDLSRASLRRR